MSIGKGSLRNLLAPIAVLLAVVLPVQPALAAIAVGQTASADATVDGVRVPSGTTLISPAVVETGDNAAVLHLSNGEVVALAPQSTAVVASADDGIQLSVERGNVAYTNNEGALDTISETETLSVDQQGQIQKGERTATDEEEERLCELQDWTADQWRACRFDDPDDEDQDDNEKDDDECDWELLKVPMSQVPQYLEKTSVLACKDRNDLDFDCNCKMVPIIVWWIPVAAVAGGAVIYGVIEGDDDEPASPTTP